MRDVRSLPRVATIATMASRQETFQKVLQEIHAQVDHVFIYLDGYATPPAFLKGLDRITVHHAEKVGDLHCSSRFLCLRELASPALVVCVDDDIAYPKDYVAFMADVLQQHEGEALLGVHGRIFMPPYQCYVRDATPLHFAAALKRSCYVHEVGTGTCAFLSDRLPVDPFEWDRHDMDDIKLSIEAKKRGLPRVAVSRPAGWLRPYAECQMDSLWIKTLKDNTEQSRLMQFLL